MSSSIPKTWSLVFANGGYNPPYHVTARAVSALPFRGGPVLGMLEEESFSEGELRLAPGDRLVLFTDGISEATNAQEDFYSDDRLIETLAAVHGLSPEVVFKLNLALDEVVTNIIFYAYDDEAEHQIQIRVALETEGVSVRVEDDGRPFNPLDATTPDLGVDVDERPIGGLGVHIVRSLMDALECRREDDRNILIMRKRTPGDTRIE